MSSTAAVHGASLGFVRIPHGTAPFGDVTDRMLLLDDGRFVWSGRGARLRNDESPMRACLGG